MPWEIISGRTELGSGGGGAWLHVRAPTRTGELDTVGLQPPPGGLCTHSESPGGIEGLWAPTRCLWQAGSPGSAWEPRRGGMGLPHCWVNRDSHRGWWHAGQQPIK